MAKYHINPKTGNPNICRADVSCPFGDMEADHYGTKGEALKAYEKTHPGSFKGSAKKPGALGHGDKLTTKEEYTNAPVGTVIQFSNGLRFVKSGNGNWETSSNGGMILDNGEISTYAEENILDKFSKVQTEEGEQIPISVSGVKVSLLQNSAYEGGLQARKYFLLFNHRNPEQLKAASGKVKDQEIVDALTEANARNAELAEAKESVEKSEANVANSKTEAQRAGYEKVLATKREKLAAAQKASDEVEARVGKHMKKYAKQLVVHRRSLDSLERLANGGVKGRPPGVEERIAKLEKHTKENRSIAPVAAKVNSGGAAGVLAGAQEFGNPIHIESASRFVAAEGELARQNREVDRLQQANASIQSRTAKDATQKELKLAQEAQQVAREKFNDAQKYIQLFLDDVRDRGDQERDIARELRALKILSR